MTRRILGALATALLLAACATGPAPPTGRSSRGPDDTARVITAGIDESADRAMAHADVRPHLVRSISPIAPQAVVDGTLSGEVTVDVRFDERGEPGSIEIKRSVSPVLSEAVLVAVRQWRMSPLVIGGKPTAFGVTQTFMFMNDAPPAKP